MDSWRYNETVGTINHHPADCQSCQEYLNHILQASLNEDVSYMRAVEDRNQHLANRRGGEDQRVTALVQETTNELRSKNEALTRQVVEEKQRVTALRRETDELRSENEALKRKLALDSPRMETSGYPYHHGHSVRDYADEGRIGDAHEYERHEYHRPLHAQTRPAIRMSPYDGR